MNIDERLERLVERHEALTESVDSLRATTQEQGANIDKILADIERDGGNIRSLLRIVSAR